MTDIALEAGENLVAVSAGDTVRWVVGDTTSGEGASAQVHILVKPIGADLETNLVITTDRRTYHLELRSADKTYMASVSWTYPASQLLALKGQQAKSETASAVLADVSVNLEQLRFRYRLDGDAPWKPICVFDDGTKVYIQFPSGFAQSEAPPYISHRSRWQASTGQLSCTRHDLHCRSPVRRRRIAARHRVATHRPHPPHRCRLAGGDAMTDNTTPDTPQPAMPEQKRKVQPEPLALRARPLPVTRINRRVLIGGAAVILAVIAARGVSWQ